MDLIDLDLIDPNPYQPRLSQDAEALDRLARGIFLKLDKLPDTKGLMQVPMARLIDGRYQLAFGHRRWSAFGQLRQGQEKGDFWATMPLNVVELTDEEMYDFAARENGDREDINPIEKAKSILEALDKFGWTLQRAASAHGMSKSGASNLTRLLQLPDAVQAWVASGSITQRQARELVRLAQAGVDVWQIVDLGRSCTGSDLSLNDLNEEVNGLIMVTADRKRVQQFLLENNKACPRCDAPVKLYGNGTANFGCGVHSWPTIGAFKLDWAERQRLEALRQDIETRRQETHTRYCIFCNHPQTFTGQDVHEGAIHRCDQCNRSVSLTKWRDEPLPENEMPKDLKSFVLNENGNATADTAVTGDASAHEATPSLLPMLPMSEIKRDGFPSICPIGRVNPVNAINCQGCRQHRYTERGTRVCMHKWYQDGDGRGTDGTPWRKKMHDQDAAAGRTFTETDRICSICEGILVIDDHNDTYCLDCGHRPAPPTNTTGNVSESVFPENTTDNDDNNNGADPTPDVTPEFIPAKCPDCGFEKEITVASIKNDYGQRRPECGAVNVSKDWGKTPSPHPDWFCSHCKASMQSEDTKYGGIPGYGDVCKECFDEYHNPPQNDKNDIKVRVAQDDRDVRLFINGSNYILALGEVDMLVERLNKASHLLRLEQAHFYSELI